MKLQYYVSGHTQVQWKALIDKATEMGCQITPFGTFVEIDTTDLESQILANTGRSEQERQELAVHIHEMLQETAQKATLVEVFRTMNAMAGSKATWDGARSIMVEGQKSTTCSSVKHMQAIWLNDRTYKNRSL